MGVDPRVIAANGWTNPVTGPDGSTMYTVPGGGTITLDPNGQVTGATGSATGDQNSGPGAAIKSALNAIGLGDVGPAEADLSGVKQAQQTAFGLESSLGAERAGYTGAYNPAIGAANITDLQNAAAGRVPSPAEMQLRNQAARNAANQYGIAAALQGRNPGAALRSAQMGAFHTMADANTQAGVLRAQEQAQARNALTQALQGQRAGDIEQTGQLLSGQVGALNAGTGAAGQAANASATAAGAKNQLYGGLVNTGARILSDRNEKTDIQPANLEKLAASLKSYRFKYKDQANGEGERVGIMAQDAEKGGPAGKAMVKLGDDGKRRLDIGNAIGAALAMSAAALRTARKAA